MDRLAAEKVREVDACERLREYIGTLARSEWRPSTVDRCDEEPWGMRERGFYPGQCYVTAMNYICDHPQQAVLVHGIVMALDVGAPADEPIEHAWVELGAAVSPFGVDTLYDGVLDGFYGKTCYYEAVGVLQSVSISAKDATRLLAENDGIAGPWKGISPTRDDFSK